MEKRWVEIYQAKRTFQEIWTCNNKNSQNINLLSSASEKSICLLNVKWIFFKVFFLTPVWSSECRSTDCDHCFSRDFCTKCKPGFQLYKGKCFTHCPLGTFPHNTDCLGKCGSTKNTHIQTLENVSSWLAFVLVRLRTISWRDLKLNVWSHRKRSRTSKTVNTQTAGTLVNCGGYSFKQPHLSFFIYTAYR